MAANEWAAVNERWVAQSLGSTITGGIWDGNAPELTSVPYCEFSTVGNAITGWSNRSRYTKFGFQLKVFAVTKAAALTMAALISEKFDFAPLSLSGSNLVECRPMTEPIPVPEDKQMWSATVTYVASWQKSANYS